MMAMPGAFVKGLGALFGLAGASGIAVANETLVSNLDREGFFKYSTADNVAETRSEIVKNGWGGVFSIEGRLFPADAESIAEGGVCSLLEEVQPFLVSQNVTAPECRSEYSESGQTVLLNGNRIKIWNTEDVARDEREPGYVWATSTKRTFDLVNELLRKAGSSEHAYAVNGGNDMLVFFLTPALQRLILEAAGEEARGAPYEMTDEPPHYGMPN